MCGMYFTNKLSYAVNVKVHETRFAYFANLLGKQKGRRDKHLLMTLDTLPEPKQISKRPWKKV